MCGTCGCKSAETLSKTSCCCGADESNPCACMKAPEPMNCSAKAPKCACYKALEKNAETFEANSDEDNCPVCNEEVYGDMSMIGEEIVPDICGDCDIYVMPQGSDFKVRCIECGYGDFYGSRTPCESCEPIADKMEAVNNGNSWRKNAEEDMVKTSFKCHNIQYNRRRLGSLDHRNWYADVMQPDDTWPSMTVSVEHKGNIEKYTLEAVEDGIREELENEISFHVKKPVDVVFFTSERLEELQKQKYIERRKNQERINHQERWWAAETFNTEYDEEDMVYCNHCSDIVGNEKEVYGDETVEYEMANGELVCITCYKIWMKEYKNDLDPHYSPFYAESFEAELSHADKSMRIWEMVQQNLNNPMAVEGFYANFFGEDKEYYDGMDLAVIEAVKDLSKNPQWTDEMFKEYGFENCSWCGKEGKKTKYLPSSTLGGGSDYWCEECYEDYEGEKWDAETFEAAVIRQGKAPKGAMAKAMMNQSMMEQANIEAMIQELENKVNLGLISEDDLMASLKKKFGAEYDIEVYSSEEMLGSVEVDSNVYYNDNNRYITVSFTDKTGEYEWEGHFYYHNLHHINSNKGLISYDPKTRMAVYDYNGIHWRGQVNFAGKGRHIFSSEEDLEAYFADLKKDNPKLAKIIEFKVKNEEYLPKKLIESSGYDYEILEAWNDYVIDDDKYALFDPCPACEGEGWIMTSYTPATRFEPADGDGEDCGECSGSGKIDPSDYMYYDDKGEIEYAAETKKRKTGFRKCSKCGYSDHNSTNCNRLNEYEEYLKHKDEMLRQCDRAIDDFTSDAKRYSEDGEYGMAKMLRSDATDMKKLKRMIEKNYFGKATHFAMGMDSQPRDMAPSALWLFDAEN